MIEAATYKAETAPAIRDLWSGGRWFDENPEKIAGLQKNTTDQYGKPAKVVTGTKADVEKTIVIKQIPSVFPFVIIEQPAQPKVINIKRALKKTKEADGDQPTQTGELISMPEMLRKWHPEVTDDDIKVWAYYQKNKMFRLSAVGNSNNGWSQYVNEQPDIAAWLEKGLIAFDGREFIPSYLYYSGNIYEKIRLANDDKQRIIEKIGEAEFLKQLNRLEKSKQELLKLDAPESERLYITPVDPFCDTIYINRLSDGTIFETDYKLVDAFKAWIKNIPRNDYKHGSNESDVRHHFIEKEQFARGTEKNEKISRERKAQLDGKFLFQRFLGELLVREDQKIIEHLWNSQYNNWTEINYKRIPVGFEMNKWFKSGPIDPREALWDGVKFLSANGSGIIAFDVGVGKTMTAILAVAQAMYTGQCKRPVIIVPNPTYAKWIGETVGKWSDGKCIEQGVLPQYRDRINDYYNLGVGFIDKLKNKPPEDYTITFLSYEGLMQLGFSETLQKELEKDLFEILNQGVEKREREKLREKIDKLIGNVTANSSVNIDDLGFDYMVIDEAHNFKNVFKSVKSRVEEDGERGQNNYNIGSGGEPSGRGVKAFCVAQYILRRNNMRNVVLLTATPFTNSPLEIYSMLAMVAYQNLEARGIENINDFFDKFINETTEMAVTVSGTIKPLAVVKSFNNKIVLQNIIFSSILYKTGEEAKVPRPKKIVYPYLKDSNGILLTPEKRVETALQANSDQKYWLNQIAQFANGDTNNDIWQNLPASYFENNRKAPSTKIPGRVLIAMSLAKNATLSPYLLRLAIDDDNYIYLYSDERPTYQQYIETSPKLQYVMECIRSVRNYHIKRKEEVSCQVIYMNMAKEYFPLIKDYLVFEVGYNEKEVAIISSGMDAAKKERIKEKFLKGEIKIIIGSATIKEGIDLQNKSTVLYNCSLDWNPTDLTQIAGRIHRQGNQHNFVRIVMPLIENSLDVFVFQKLEEKTSRINDIWYRAGRNNVLDVDELNPEELKNGLMTNPEERAKSERDQEVDKIKFEKEIFENYLNELNQAKYILSDFKENSERIDGYFTQSEKILKNKLTEFTNDLDAGLREDGEPMSNTDKKALQTKIDSLNKLFEQELTDKTKFAYIRRYVKIFTERNGWTGEASRITDLIDKQIKRIGDLDRLQKNILDKNGLTVTDDLSPVIDDYTQQVNKLHDKLMQVQSTEYLTELVNKYEVERKKAEQFSKPLDERVKEFERYNHLLSCLKDFKNNIYGDCDNDGKMVKQTIEIKEPVKKREFTEAEIQKRIEGMRIVYELTNDPALLDRIEGLEIVLSIAA